MKCSCGWRANHAFTFGNVTFVRCLACAQKHNRWAKRGSPHHAYPISYLRLKHEVYT